MNAYVAQPSSSQPLSCRRLIVISDQGRELYRAAMYAKFLFPQAERFDLVAIARNPRSVMECGTRDSKGWGASHESAFIDVTMALEAGVAHLRDEGFDCTSHIVDPDTTTLSATESVFTTVSALNPDAVVVVTCSLLEKRDTRWDVDPVDLAESTTRPLLHIPLEYIDRAQTCPTKLTVAYDGGPGSLRALNHCAVYAPQTTTLDVINVEGRELTGGQRGACDSAKLLKQANEILCSRRRSGTASLIRAGDRGRGVAEAILDKARIDGASAIVAGKKRRPLLERWVLGCVGERILRLAKCPVLLFPSPDESASRRFGAADFETMQWPRAVDRMPLVSHEHSRSAK